MVLLKAFVTCESSKCSEEFCKRNGLRRKAVMEVRHLRQQLADAGTKLTSRDCCVSCDVICFVGCLLYLVSLHGCLDIGLGYWSWILYHDLVLDTLS